MLQLKVKYQHPTAEMSNPWRAERFAWHAAFTAVLFLNSFCPTSVSTLCVGLVHELPLLRNNTAVKKLYSNRKRCQVLTGNLSQGRQPAGDWANTWHWTKRFTITAINRWPSVQKTTKWAYLPSIKEQLKCFGKDNWTVGTGSFCSHSDLVILWANGTLWHIFTLLLIELPHFLDSKTQFFTL